MFINFYDGVVQPQKEELPAEVCYLVTSTNFIGEQYAAMTVILNKRVLRQQMKNIRREGFRLPSAPQNKVDSCEQMN